MLDAMLAVMGGLADTGKGVDRIEGDIVGMDPNILSFTSVVWHTCSEK